VNFGFAHRGGLRWILTCPLKWPKIFCIAGESILSGLPHLSSHTARHVIRFLFFRPSQRGLNGEGQSGGARGRRGITRLYKRSAEGGDTEPEGKALALEREVRR
jgi:hypothetical protein